MIQKPKDCRRCKHWHRIRSEAGRNIDAGECRFHAPRIAEVARTDQLWPNTLHDQWCGKYKERKRVRGGR